MKWTFLFALVLFSFSNAYAGELSVKETDETITILNGNAIVLVYNKAPTADAAENDPVYTRTGYIHPIYTPSGKQVTDDFAPDHPHQHGLFFAWTKTSYEGRKPEFWNEKKKAGKVHFDEIIELVEEDNAAGFVVKHRWEDLKAPGGAKSVLSETWEVQVQIRKSDYCIDLTSTQKVIGESPLEIEKYHYGGMAIRGSREWMGEEDSLMETSEGHGRTDGNHTRPEWVQMSGEIDGDPCGIVALQDKQNFRYPQWVRLHPAKPYFVFAPMVEEPFTIEPGDEYVSKFRYIVFDGEEPDIQ
ncbi:MAG: PmoA family protein [Verrucomicrobiales bacterium]|nr:PmoA family protein [Verrucomicrobiales bacterium]